jgi:hypothetical protein
MLIKDLIARLQELHDREMAYHDVMGEPSIEIDVFKCVNETERLYQYAGIHTGNIVFDRSKDGVYNIITAFAEAYPKDVNTGL